jgi:hypothetical protein
VNRRPTQNFNYTDIQNQFKLKKASKKDEEEEDEDDEAAEPVALPDKNVNT